MKYLLAPILVLCAGCVATQAAMDQLSQDLLALQNKPFIEAEDFEVLADDVEVLKAAPAKDKENFIEGLGNAGAATGAGGLLAAGIAAAQWYRNRNLPGSQRKPTA